jgi:Ribbon-helix-helix protein, copG family
MKRPRIARISMTLPADLLRQTDQEAKRLGRSRSWVIAEALRRAQGGIGAPPGLVREAAIASPYLAVHEELEAARDRRLRAALALSPAERLRQANELVRLARAVRPPRSRSQVIAFDTFEDFWLWKRAHRAAGAVRS